MIPPEPDPPGPGPDPPEPTYTYHYILKVTNGSNQTYDFKVGFGSNTSDITEPQSLAYNATGTFEYESDTAFDYIRVYRGSGYSARSFGIISGCEYYVYTGTPQKDCIVPLVNQGTYDVYVTENTNSNRFELEV